MNEPDPYMHMLIAIMRIPENTLSTVQNEEVAYLLDGKVIYNHIVNKPSSVRL